MLKERLLRVTRGTIRLLMISAVLGIAVLGVPRLYAAARYQGQVQAVPAISGATIGIVFGAGLRSDGAPSLILADRVAAAADLYHAGKVQKLLLSGDNRFVEYNEPQSMYDYGQRLGVPAEAMVMDFAGRRTYDTCRRARDVFQVTHAVLVTQRYHLDRALLTCDGLGLDVRGVAADRSSYPRGLFIGWWIRELPATTQALWDVYVAPPRSVVLGEPLPILTDGPRAASRWGCCGSQTPHGRWAPAI